MPEIEEVAIEAKGKPLAMRTVSTNAFNTLSSPTILIKLCFNSPWSIKLLIVLLVDLSYTFD